MYPVLLQIGPLSFHTIWISIAIALIGASSLFSSIAKRERLSFEPFLKHGWSLVIAILIGSRLLFLLGNMHLFIPHQPLDLLRPFFLWDRGLSFWGGLLFFMLRLFMILRNDKKLFLQYVDALAAPLCFGYAIGKVGAFFDGATFGIPTNMPWGIIFNSANVPYTVPIHPTQLYAALYATAIGFGVLRFLRWYPKGYISILAAEAFSIVRFLEEFMRGDEVTMIGAVRLPQILAAAFAVSLGYLIYKERTVFQKPFQQNA